MLLYTKFVMKSQLGRLIHLSIVMHLQYLIYVIIFSSKSLFLDLKFLKPGSVFKTFDLFQNDFIHYNFFLSYNIPLHLTATIFNYFSVSSCYLREKAIRNKNHCFICFLFYRNT
jgi:hypothetical protein